MYAQNSSRLIENKLKVTKGVRGGTNEEYGINRYKLLDIKQMNNKEFIYINNTRSIT